LRGKTGGCLGARRCGRAWRSTAGWWRLIDYSLFAIPKPGKRRRDGIKVYPDGREVCQTKAAWAKRRYEVWRRDGMRCVDCKRALELDGCEIDHIKKRGMGGATRDDRMENLRTMCPEVWGCHAKRHRELEAA
jgi:hypothetical protein